ncbi:MAG: hypothetical protein PHO40_06915 [Candidatus Omnitrophica bacterium]|nr:hypothetical protein [Candidatus Omnitrophota bacterium]
MKKFLIVIGIVVIFLMVIAFSKNLIIKSVVTKAAFSITGAPVHMNGFQLNIFSSTINISGFKMYNPRGFPEGTLVSCPKIKVIYDRASLFKQKRHLLLVEIELKEIGLTKNKEGKLNVDELRLVKESKSSAPIPMQIDLLTLSIGKIVYKDYTVGTEPSVRVYDVNKRKSYKGIPTVQQLALLVLAEPMKEAAIKNAQIYGATLLTGVAVLPAALVATYIGKDYVRQIIDVTFEHLYKISLDVVKRMGSITKEDEPGGVIKANIHGASVALILRKAQENKTEITISARKYMFPKLDIAGGVLYQILDKLR